MQQLSNARYFTLTSEEIQDILAAHIKQTQPGGDFLHVSFVAQLRDSDATPVSVAGIQAVVTVESLHAELTAEAIRQEEDWQFWPEYVSALAGV